MLETLNFRFDNNTVRALTEDGAKRYAADNKCKILKAWPINKPEPGLRRVQDGFQPGWQYSLGMYVDSYEKFKRIMKDRGLIEMGYEKPKEQVYYDEINQNKRYKEIYSDESLRQIANEVGGLSLSGGEVERLRSED